MPKVDDKEPEEIIEEPTEIEEDVSKKDQESDKTSSPAQKSNCVMLALLIVVSMIMGMALYTLATSVCYCRQFGDGFRDGGAMPVRQFIIHRF